MINGSFRQGSTGWTVQNDADISGAYGFFPNLAPAALWLKCGYGFAPTLGSCYQDFAVADGQVLRGRLMLRHETTSPAKDTEFAVYYEGRLKYSIGAESMSTGAWALFTCPFDAVDAAVGAGGTLLFTTIPDGPQGSGGGYARFLVDGLTLSPEETSMIAESLMKWLDDEGFGTEGTDLFCSHEPESPDAVVSVHDESTPVLWESQGLAADRFGVSIRVRDADYTDARDTLIAIHRRLCAFSGELTAGSPAVIMVDPLSAPTFMMRDTDKRSIWIAQYALVVQSEGDQYRT